jgi:hypothetical protein
MNSDKFDQWQDDIRTRKIDGLDDSIRRKIEKQKQVFRLSILKTASAFVLTLFIAFALLVNLSPEFYTFAYNNKIIGPIAEMLKYSNRNDTESAFNADYAQRVDLKLVSGDYELLIDYVISDIYTVSLFGKLNYQGKPFEQTLLTPFPRIELLDDEGNSLSQGAGYKTFEDYKWIEMELTKPNPFQPITIRFNPDESDPSKAVSARLSNHPEKTVELIKQSIGKSFSSAEMALFTRQTVVFDTVEIGAFQSRLKLHGDAGNDMQLGDVEIKYTYLDKEASMFTMEGIDGKQTHSFTIGQLTKPGPVTIELISATFIQKAYVAAEFNVEKLTMVGLPDYLSIKDIVKREGKFEFTLVNQHGNYLAIEIASFTGIYAASHENENPAETHIYFDNYKQNPAVLKFKIRETVKMLFDDAKFIVKW